MATNKLFTVGRLCTEPDLKETQSGRSRLAFRLASDTRVADGNNGFIANFYNVTIWGRQGEAVAPYLHKGDRVAVTGDFVARPYIDTNGAQRISLDINNADLEMLTTKAERAQAQPTAAPAPSPVSAPSPSDDDDDAPF